ncbi:hypothetical protein [Nitrosomonas marina]|uniref:Uncharacterized protein n=1 Tax=Nitrosomonas marina TaxID=917 RepID=A0A1H8GIW9_9PROT|nr:hypothetical protein [Nitrosomonas marina]SEN43913.1 hypothetical protein SAMN05216325_11848 [Nitrosomonas marina]
MWPWEMKWLFDYTDSEAQANADFQIECINSLERAANNLLILLLTGAGGALALFVSIRNDGAPLWLQGGMLASSVYLFAIACVLVLKCMQASDIAPPTNDPKNLYNSKTAMMNCLVLKKEILESKQRCIESNRDCANIKGKWLNIVSIMATATPVVFGIGAAAFRLIW